MPDEETECPIKNELYPKQYNEMNEFTKPCSTLGANKISRMLMVGISTLLISFFFGQLGFAKKISCGQWMGMDSLSAEYQTDKTVIDSCDDKTFKVLNHEYAKDKNFVYYKPMPNANNLTVILNEADSKSFKLLERCKGYAMDKNHVFLMGKIVEDKSPIIFEKYDPNSPETFCY